MPIRPLLRALLLWMAAVPLAWAADAPIAPADLAARIARHEAPLIVDVRSAKEYADGHLPGALNIPHDEIARRWTALNARRDQEIVLYCHSGRRAGLAQQALEKLDFTHTRLLDGSIQAWQAATLPLQDERGPEPQHD